MLDSYKIFNFYDGNPNTIFIRGIGINETNPPQLYGVVYFASDDYDYKFSYYTQHKYFSTSFISEQKKQYDEFNIRQLVYDFINNCQPIIKNNFNYCQEYLVSGGCRVISELPKYCMDEYIFYKSVNDEECLALFSSLETLDSDHTWSLEEFRKSKCRL